MPIPFAPAVVAAALTAPCPPCAPCATWDWNANGIVDCDDIDRFMADFAAQDPCADWDLSNTWTSDDTDGFWNAWYSAHCATLGSPCAALDRNQDGAVNCRDADVFEAAYAANCPLADISDGVNPLCDGIVTPDDHAYFYSVYNAPIDTCAARAANDECADAMQITPGTTAFDTCSGTTGVTGQGDACGGNNGVSIVRDLWFRFTATQSCPVRLRVPSTFAKVAVYDRCPDTISQAIACSSNLPGSTPDLTFPVTPGNVYLIQVGVKVAPPGQTQSNGGSSIIQLQQAVEGETCDCPAPINLPGAGQTLTIHYNTLGGQTDGPPQPACFSPPTPQVYRDRWYRVRIPDSISLGVTLQAQACSPMDDRIVVYEELNGCPQVASDLVACADVGEVLPCPASGPGVTFGAVAGRSYLIRIGVGPTEAGGNANLFLARPLAPTCGTGFGTQTRVYRLTGCGTGVGWSWALRAAGRVSGDCFASGVGVPPSAPAPCPANTTYAVRVAGAFTGMIRSTGQCRGNVLMLQMTCASPLVPNVDCAWFSIQAAQHFNLYVGAYGQNPDCLVSALGIGVPGAGVCSFNPGIEEVPLDQLDGNGNGVPDFIEIADGRLTDANANGIADEFELPVCDPDYDQNGIADQDDVVYLINVIAGGPNPTERDPDFDQNGIADQDDILALINTVAGGGCPGE